MTRKRHTNKRMHMQKGKITIHTQQHHKRKQDGTIHLFDLPGGTRIKTDEQLEAALKDKPTSKKIHISGLKHDFTYRPANPTECNFRYIRNELELLQELKQNITTAKRTIVATEKDLLAMCSNEVLIAIKQGLVTPTFHISEYKLNLALSGLDEEPTSHKNQTHPSWYAVNGEE